MSVRFRRPWATWCAIAGIAAGFALELYAGADVVRRWGLWPVGSGFRAEQLASYAFLHASAAHLVANCAALAWLGRDLELRAGVGRLLRLLVVSTAAGGAVEALAGAWAAPTPTVGASAAVCGLFGTRWGAGGGVARWLWLASAVVLVGLASPGPVATAAHIGGLAAAAALESCRGRAQSRERSASAGRG